jgi:hypothetical protein
MAQEGESLLYTKNKTNKINARDWWLTPVILVTQEAEIRRRIAVQSHPGQFKKPYLKTNHHKKKVLALSSNLSTAKKKKKNIYIYIYILKNRNKCVVSINYF